MLTRDKYVRFRSGMPDLHLELLLTLVFPLLPGPMRRDVQLDNSLNNKLVGSN